MIPYLDLQKINAPYAEEIKRATEKILSSGIYLFGEETKKFENNYSEYIGTKHAIVCGNGLDALTLILIGYQEIGLLRPGDEVIVPANTYIASILAINRAGLTPVLVEPDPHTLQIDPENIEKAISRKTRAIMIVHLYGQCSYSSKIGEICNQYNLLLIEDNAQAHGAEFKNHKTGSLGNAAGHSFYPGKNLGALGDAGAVTTDNDDLADAIRSLRNYGSQSKYIFKYQGFNSRMDEIQAAVLNIKLPHLDKETDRRKEIGTRYLKEINNPLITLPGVSTGKDNVFHIFPIFSDNRNGLKSYLKERGIETLIHYPIPPHKQECLAQWHNLSLPVTERIHATELSLPISSALTNRDVSFIIDSINNFKNL